MPLQKSRSSLSLFAETLRLLHPFWRLIAFATALGAIGGLATAWLLATINDALHTQSSMALAGLAAFAGLALLSVGGHLIAGVTNGIIGQRIVAKLRKEISSRILRAPISAIEQAKAHRLLTILNGDINKIGEFIHHFAGYATAFTVVLGCLLYLIHLSPMMFMLSMLIVLVGAMLNHWAMQAWLHHFERSRELEDDLQKRYRAITEGAKELRLNLARRARVEHGQIAGAADEIAVLNSKAFTLFWIAETLSIALLFVIIGAILATRSVLGIDNAAISGFIIVMLFAKGPVEELAGALPVFSQAQVSFRRIVRLSSEFSRSDITRDQATKPMSLSYSIALRDVVYSFQKMSDVDSSFMCEVSNLEIRRGEIIFITGANGSGKTTLIKLILGLYKPLMGSLHGGLYLDDDIIDDDRRDAYRQLFSAVFSDYYLFEDLMDLDPAALAQARALLRRLDLADKVGIDDGVFSTTDLSTGQRKRLGLVHALLENRPVMMFDEWAAEQDQTYREFFYRELLPELKRSGKTLIIVSHDERYFDIADRIVRVADGRIQAIEPRVASHAATG
ncbi:cyclic peptide export ABC transporter [Boseaceae bacterium BT-24-1]|nr:cyclic peptide export ABC transporter [Boseaceae bacterium BT-24-1]